MKFLNNKKIGMFRDFTIIIRDNKILRNILYNVKMCSSFTYCIYCAKPTYFFVYVHKEHTKAFYNISLKFKSK